MIHAIEESGYELHKDTLDAMFRLRKRVFADELQWDVPVHGDMEYDDYDRLGPVYLTMESSERTELFASMRLLPTTGPTLLHDVFDDTAPDIARLSAPNIWECTRFCCDQQADKARTEFQCVHPAHLLLVGLCEYALAKNIDFIVANFDPAMVRVYRSSGCEVEVLGKSTKYGVRPVACGMFEVSHRILNNMRQTLKLDSPVFGSTVGFDTHLQLKRSA